MYFGLTNSPATFQTMMNFIYRDTILKHEQLGTTIRVYMDDIGIATRTNLDDHRHAVSDVLRVAQLHDLYFKPEKCLFHSSSMDYLGVILEKGVTRMDPAKIAGVDTWPVPKTATEVRKVLGFFNFYRPFMLRSRPTCHGIRRTVIDTARGSLVFHFFCIILRLDPCRTGPLPPH